MLMSWMSVLNLINSYSPSDVYACAELIFKFDLCHAVFVYSETDFLLEEISRVALRTSAQVINLEEGEVPIESTADFISVLSDNLTVIQQFFYLLSKNDYFKPTAHYFVMYFGNEEVDQILGQAGGLYISTILLLDKYNDLYTTLPYEEGCRVRQGKKYVGSCAEVEMSQINGVYDLRPQGSGCEVRVYAREKYPFVMDVRSQRRPGMEVEVLRSAAKRYNFSLKFMPDFGRFAGLKNSDGSYSGLMEWLYERKADILIGNVRANESYLDDFTGSIPYFPNAYYFYVPAAKEASNWNAIARVFTSTMWLVVSATSAVQLLTIYITHTKLSILDAFGVSIEQGVASNPSATIHRCLFLVWLWYTFVITSSYKAKLLSFLIKPAYEKQISTFDEIVASKLKYGGVPYSRQYFQNATEESSRVLYQNWVNCPYDLTCINRTVFKGDMATMENEYFVNHHRNNYLDHKMRPKYYRIPNGIMYYLWMVMQKGLPVQDQINRLISSYRDSGLLIRIKKGYFPKVKKEESAEFQAITLDEILLSFYIYLGGAVLSIGTFLIEYFFQSVSLHTMT